MSLLELIELLKSTPQNVEFSDVLEVIDNKFTFTPTSFTNGDIINKAGQNNGSCKVLYFAKQYELTKDQTLHCFGSYYRKDVLTDPNGNSHQNIRNFITYGWEGIKFEGSPLTNDANKYKN